ncbi:MAG: hypothetical protein JNL19_08545 [Burkholderiales bacterium]|nr:hypothetical protein [Burkholderiales bacterium]
MSATIDDLIEQALDSSYPKDDAWAFACAEAIPPPAKKYKLRQLHPVKLNDDVRDKRFVVGWKDYRTDDIELAMQITEVWRLATNSDPDERRSPIDYGHTATLVQNVAACFPRACLASALDSLAVLSAVPSTTHQGSSFSVEALTTAIRHQDWQDIGLLTSLNCPQLVRFGPTMVESLHRYALRLVRVKKLKDPIDLLAAAAVVWFDAAIDARANNDAASTLRTLGLASEAWGISMYYFGFKVGLMPDNHATARPTASDAGRALAEKSAEARRLTTAKLRQDYASLALSRNKAATVLSEKYNLAWSTVRDKLKGV